MFKWIITILLVLSSIACETKQYVWNKEIGIQNLGAISRALETKNGHFILVGKVFSGDKDSGLAIRLDRQGNEVWKKIFTEDNDFIFKDVVELKDGSLVLLGLAQNSKKAIKLLKIDAYGNLVWKKTLKFPFSAIGERIVSLEDALVIAGAREDVNGQEHGLVIGLDFQGEKKWLKSWKGKGNGHFYALGAGEDGLVVAGRSQDERLKSRAWAMKLSWSGEKEWEHFLVLSALQNVFDLTLTRDGSIAFAGVVSSEDTGSEDLLIYKLDNKGRLQWKRQFGGVKSEKILSLVQNKEGVFYLGGYTWNYRHDGYDFWLLTLNEEGNFMWDKTFGSKGFEGISTLLLPQRGGLLLAGFREGGDLSTTSLWVARLNQRGEALVEKKPSYFSYVGNYFYTSLWMLSQPFRKWL